MRLLLEVHARRAGRAAATIALRRSLVLWTVAIGSVVALGQPFAVVHHGAYGYGQLEYNVPFGFALQRNIAGGLDLLQIAG